MNQSREWLTEHPAAPGEVTSVVLLKAEGLIHLLRFGRVFHFAFVPKTDNQRTLAQNLRPLAMNFIRMVQDRPACASHVVPARTTYQPSRNCPFIVDAVIARLEGL